MNSRFEFLAGLPIFEAVVDDEALEALAGACEEYEYVQGSVIAYQRDIAHGLFMVRSGRLFAQRIDANGAVRDTKVYWPEETFGDEWLFDASIHPMTVKGAEDGRLLFLPGERFLEVLEEYPALIYDLEPAYDEADTHVGGLSEEAWEAAGKVRVQADRPSAAISLLPDELVEYHARRSRYFLLLRMILPAVGLTLLPALAYNWLDSNDFTGLTLWSLPASLALLFTGWAIFRWLDWLNDYFVITNSRIVHREFELRTFRINVIKIPISQVQSVEIEKPNILATALNFGTARITTAAAAGTVYFDNIDDPAIVKEILDAQAQRFKELDVGQAQESLRKAVESHFELPPAYQEYRDDAEEEEDVYQTPGAPRESLWTWFWDRFRWRVEAGNVLTYRKNFFVLLRAILRPAVAIFTLFVAGLFMISYELVSVYTLGAFVLLFLILLGWFIWSLEDWRNDIFQVTDRLVVDIDRRPFGFGESRKQAPLSNIQNVSAERPGLLATIFNYGSVKIETAGATADIEFEGVPRPSDVQSDIFHRMDENKQRRQAREGKARQREYAILLDVYHQAMEQDRIPRRTPFAEPEESETSES